jgi:putative transposase
VALTNWDGSRTGKRRGPKVRFPRFKGKRAGLSCRFTTGAFGLADADRRHVKLPRIGLVRTHESTRKLARHIERGTARVRSATVSFRAGRWFVAFSVEITRADPAPTRPGSAVGVDLGVKSLAVLSTGETVPNPRHLEIAQRELRRQAARRRGPDRRTRRKPSARWLGTQARIGRLHTAVANARRDGLHKLTTRLVRTYGAVVIEDLNVAGMTRNRRLARHIAGVGMAELRRQIEYKAHWSGVHVHIADRWYPSSKTCSACGVVKAKLRLSERTFRCDACGLVLDRDLNAARNLAALVRRETSSRVAGRRETSPLETHVRPAPRGQRVPPREDPHQPVRANADTATRRLPEHGELTFTHTSGNGQSSLGMLQASRCAAMPETSICSRPSARTRSRASSSAASIHQPLMSHNVTAATQPSRQLPSANGRVRTMESSSAEAFSQSVS